MKMISLRIYRLLDMDLDHESAEPCVHCDARTYNWLPVSALGSSATPGLRHVPPPSTADLPARSVARLLTGFRVLPPPPPSRLARRLSSFILHPSSFILHPSPPPPPPPKKISPPIETFDH